MEADVQMDVHLDVATPGYVGRLEVVEGPTGRRVRTEGERARIAAESLLPGAQVAVVARKHGATRSQVNDVNPVAYIAETLDAIINGHPQSAVEDLMPWRFRKTSTPNP